MKKINKKSILFIVVFTIIIIILYFNLIRKNIIIQNNEIFDTQNITDDMLENSLKCKIDNIYYDDDNLLHVKVIVKSNDCIYELKFIDTLKNIDFSNQFNEGDELFLDGYLENNFIYVKQIYKNMSLEERQTGE